MSTACPICKTDAKFLFNTKDHNEKITDQIEKRFIKIVFEQNPNGGRG